MYAFGSQIAQTRPANTNTATAFTATVRTEVSCIIVANTTSAAATYSIYHDDDGTTYSEATALFFSVSLPAYTTDKIDFGGAGGGIHVAPGGSIGVKSGTSSAITYSLYGVTANVTGRN